MIDDIKLVEVDQVINNNGDTIEDPEGELHEDGNSIIVTDDTTDKE